MATDTVDVWTTYKFECPECEGITENNWMPMPGDELVCDDCGNEVVVGEITEDCRPARYDRTPSTKTKASRKKKK